MPSSQKSPVTLADIAHKAGVSRMTVSLALRDHPRTSAATRMRIQSIATQLGYMPDARLASWMTHIRASAEKTPVTIAWINTAANQNTWHEDIFLTPYRKGAEACCAKFGYKLEDFWLHAKGMTSGRLSKILYTRGIRGIIISPPQNSHGLGGLKLNWAHFSLSSFEDKVLHAPQIHRVIQNWFYNITLALKILRRSGYRRIGVCCQGDVERRSAHAMRASVHDFQQRIQPVERVPFFVNQNPNVLHDKFINWMHEHRPDVVVGMHSELIKAVNAAGFKVPHEVGVVHLFLDGDCEDWAGIWARKYDIGAAAADIVISQLQKNAYGLPSIPSDILIPGHWHSGKTLLQPKAPQLSSSAHQFITE